MKNFLSILTLFVSGAKGADEQQNRQTAVGGRTHGRQGQKQCQVFFSGARKV